MSAYIDENLISAHDGTKFEIIKQTKTSVRWYNTICDVAFKI